MERRKFLKLAGLTAAAASGTVTSLRNLATPLQVLASVTRKKTAKVICLGLDGMDPQLLTQYMSEGIMPHFLRLARDGDFRTCMTSIPPQSPVAWSNFITGQDSGGHAIFDFIHRDPDLLMPMLSMSKACEPDKYFRFGDWKIPRSGGGVALLRRGRAFWEYLADADIDTTIFKMPSNFPPVDCRVRSISGMGTPDIQGTYGIFGYYTTEPPENTDIGGGRIVPVSVRDNCITSDIQGPPNLCREGNPDTKTVFESIIDPDNSTALFKVGDSRFVLQQGEWSDWISVDFELIPHLKTVHGICRFYLMEVKPTFRLYVSPVQIDPTNPAMPISTPPGYAREIVENTGPFYTQGLPDDTKALDEGIFEDADYVSQANLVLEERLNQYRYELDRFCSLDRGYLFFYFNSLDQNCHMFWRNMDPESPRHDDADGEFRNRIRDMYIAMDQVLGRTMDAIDQQTVLFVVSDHGFAPYHRSFHVNTWLLDNGYLHVQMGKERDDVAYLDGINWNASKAYALGINGLYLNVRGRERRGAVKRGAERKALLSELAERLESFVDPITGKRPIKQAYIADEVYTGPHSIEGPDIILGYRRGYRGSNESALGKIASSVCSDNVLKWTGDHCMAADEVPGVLLCNQKITKQNPSLVDMAPTFLRLFGLNPTPEMVGSDLFVS